MPTCLRPLAVSLLAAFSLHCGVALAAPADANPAQGVYVGEIGPGNAVLLTLEPAAPGSAVTGAYHPALGWNQQDWQLSGQLSSSRRLNLRATESSAHGKAAEAGRFDARVSEDGARIAGTWTSADGRRRLPVSLTRAASWSTQAVEADGGVRTCERPQFADARYERVNRELAEACDYFLADGHEGPGKLRLEIDSLGQYMVAAIAYARNRGAELPPEVIAVDLGSEDDSLPGYSPARTRAIASRP
ncbi:MAG TPA: hypothetical protein VH105_10940 [Burkholderiales bacterium]|jgi:hypothetical protein|nr:hypothetical protein [Burkholderiales bacterium]